MQTAGISHKKHTKKQENKSWYKLYTKALYIESLYPTSACFSPSLNLMWKVSQIKLTLTTGVWYQEYYPLENSHPENSHPSNPPHGEFFLENSHPSNSPLENSPLKIPTQKIFTLNIPTHIFKHFVFSLLSATQEIFWIW